MKISKDQVSAFSIYSKKLQRKKPNISPVNGVSKTKNNSKNFDLNEVQMKEIKSIMENLVKKSKEFGKNNSVANTSEISEENISNRPQKVGETVKKKLSAVNIKKRPNKEKTKHALPKKALNGNIRKKNLISEERHAVNFSPNRGKANLLRQKKNKRLLDKQNKSKRLLQISNKFVTQNENENDILDKAMLTKVNNINQTGVVVKKKKEKKLGSNRTNQENSAVAAKRLFEWLILPITAKDFMSDYWEKKPLFIQREGNRTYFSELISTLEIDSMIRKNNIQFTKHLDITSYTDQKRETHNLSGRAQANVVWDFYSNGCSVRLLNPQAFLPKIHTLNATLQGYFGCFVGANVYLTPPNSQGFAPHYDDIEAFVLQIEGKKHWKVYQPRNDSEILPRYSSPNFKQDEIGSPVLEVILEPGDMLYFPRGFIHQASTVQGEHSLHITLSAYQKTAWVDLLEKAIPVALERAAAADVEFRRGLPRDYLGIEFHGSYLSKESFTNTAQRLMSKVAHFLQFSLGAGVDKMGAQFMHDALPPVFTPEERLNMVLGSGLKMKEKGKLDGRVEFQMETEIKLVRANVCRLVEEEGELRLYHCLDNPLEYHADEPQFLVLPPEGGQVITYISTHYPAFVQIQTLPHTDKDALLTLVSDLWDAGLLVAKGLPTVNEDD